MKKNRLLSKIIIFATIISACLAVIFSAVKLDFKNNNTQNQKTSSAVSFIDSDGYIRELLGQTNEVSSKYNLVDTYPIFGENQTNSNLCWIYSSSKALETALMVQKNLYYNFSEIGTALLGYKNGVCLLNDMGDFKKFNMITQNYGLIHENDLNNDVFDYVNETNFENFSNAINLTDENFMDSIKPILISEDNFFISLNLDEKKLVLKRFIMQYGGFYSGLNTGKITNSDNIYTEILPDPNKPTNPLDSVVSPDKAIKTPHAVCIIGWDDEKGWLALNSWGRSSLDYQTFYIPFEVNHVYGTASSYICEKDNDIITLSNSSASEFSQDIKNSNTTTKNLFVNGEEIKLDYKISESYDFYEVYVNIFSGTEDVTRCFDLDFSENGIFKLNSLSENLSKYSGEYQIRFYVKDELIKIENFYVYTGTELSYVELIKGASEVDSVQLSNIFLSSNKSATYYVSSGGSNDTDFRLGLVVPETILIQGNVIAEAGKVYEIVTTSDESESKQEISSVSVSLNPQSTRFELSIYGLTRGNSGKLIEITVKLTSKSTGYECEYNFKFFISSNIEVTTKDANYISYVIGDGKNSEQNISKYPDYSKEDIITEFVLKAPSSLGSSEFLGWYLDSEFTNQITKIDSNLTGDLVLYAKWKESELNYFEADFSIDSVLHYGEKSEMKYNSTDEIIYGDSVNILLNFSPNEEILAGYNYYVRYVYYLDNKDISFGILKQAEQIKFLNDFSKLAAGEHKASIIITMNSISVTKEISFSVSKRIVSVNFSETEIQYDRNFHSPKMDLNNVLLEDSDVSAIYEIEGYQELNGVKEVGTYTFIVTGISNLNYKISENQITTLKITEADFYIIWQTQGTLTYSGYAQKINYTQSNTGDDLVEVGFKYYIVGNDTELSQNDFKNVGTYRVVASITSKNYKLAGITEEIFTIQPKKITITFDNIEERYTVAPNNRKKISYKINGLVGADTASSLIVSYSCEGLTAESSGTYPITGRCTSQNYEASIVNGTYKILGFYHVYYTLPNGEVYDEIVDDGYAPKGITRDIYKAPFLSKIVYDKELVQGDGDLTVKVSYKSYVWLFITGIVVAVIVVAYLIITKNIRRMKNR